MTDGSTVREGQIRATELGAKEPQLRGERIRVGAARPGGRFDMRGVAGEYQGHDTAHWIERIFPRVVEEPRLAEASKDAIRSPAWNWLDVPGDMVRKLQRQQEQALVDALTTRPKIEINFAMSSKDIADLRPELRKLAEEWGFAPPAPKPDPRAAREARRREIDAVLREDARRFPAFATARRAAVMAWEEDRNSRTDAAAARYILDTLRDYEEHRGAGRVLLASLRGRLADVIADTYERNRARAAS